MEQGGGSASRTPPLDSNQDPYLEYILDIAKSEEEGISSERFLDVTLEEIVILTISYAMYLWQSKHDVFMVLRFYDQNHAAYNV